MIIATWVVLAVLSCLCQALSPPVKVALESDTRDLAARDGGVIPLPSKRILKYFLPSAQAWATHGAGGVFTVPTGPEGNKRGYGDRNFLRFGRSGDAVKKFSDRNFLRFGRGGNDEDENDEDGPASVEKRNRNFLRFGRNRNFLRFGRSDPEQVGLKGSPFEFGRGLQEDDSPVEDERVDLENYLRYSRPDKNFLRFGRTYDKNFLRFGRSVDAQTLCDGCEEDNLDKPLKSSSFSSSSSSFPASRVSGEPNVDGDYQLVKEIEARQSEDTNEKKEVRWAKREAPTYFSSSISAPHGDFDRPISAPHGDFDSSISGHHGDIDSSSSISGPHGDFDSSISGPHGPAFWGRDNQHTEEQHDDSSASLGLDDLREIAKKPYSRDFLRYGRDRNFLRFGKRFYGTSPESDMMMMTTPLQYTSKRVSHNNFLRFG